MKTWHMKLHNTSTPQRKFKAQYVTSNLLTAPLQSLHLTEEEPAEKTILIFRMFDATVTLNKSTSQNVA